MAIPSTHSWSAGATLEEPQMENNINAPINALAGRSGVIEYEDSLVIPNGTGGDKVLALPTGTTAQRPASPGAGAIRFNTTLNNIEYHNGTGWVELTSIIL